jgi:hypothetical protein
LELIGGILGSSGMGIATRRGHQLLGMAATHSGWKRIAAAAGQTDERN